MIAHIGANKSTKGTNGDFSAQAVAWAWTEAEARIFDTLSTEATRMALATSKKNSSRRGRGKPDRLETHDPKPEATKAPPIPDHVTPVGVEISSLRHPCDACGTHWEDSKLTRSAADATEPIRHVVYAVNDVIWPVITLYDDEATGKPTIDIWPVKADLLSVWLCPSCYAVSSAQGIPVWAWDLRQAFADAAFARKSSRGVPELCRERFDEMEAEWARERFESRWAQSMAAEREEAIGAAYVSESSLAIQHACALHKNTGGKARLRDRELPSEKRSDLRREVNRATGSQSPH